MIKIAEQKPIIKLLNELRVRSIRICIIMITIVLLCMTLGVAAININGYHLLVLYPDTFNSLSIQIITQIKNDLLPTNINLVQTTPGQAFAAQLYVAIIIGIVGSLPVIFAELISFLNPALHYYEKKTIKRIVIPTVLLFVIGCLFAYLIVIPYTLDFLYKYGQSMDIMPFFEITSFIMFVLNLLMVFGFTYLLPIIMWAITKMDIVKPNFWRNNLRYMIIILIVIGALLTPDGSGITMWFIAGPMVLLYVIGIITIRIDLRISKYH